MAEQSEILSLREQLEKAQDQERITDLLQTLSGKEMTYPLLKATKIGQTVSKLRKHEIHGKVAKQMLKAWKKLAPATPRSSATDQQAGWGQAGEKEKPLLNKPPPAEGMRKIAYTRLLGVFNIDLGLFEEEETQYRAQEVEEAMHQKYGDDKKGYKEKYMQLISNLKKNDNLRANVMAGSTAASALMDMTSQDMQTEERKAQIKKAKEDIFNRDLLNWEEKNEDLINAQCNIKNQAGIFKCGKCKGMNTSNYQKQTRSADEPMTVFVRCKDCGNRWRC